MTPSNSNDNRYLIYWVIAIAAFAFCLRIAYQAGMVAFDGSFHNGSDSGKYIRVAHALWVTGVEPDTERLPLYNYFLFAIFKLVGSESLRAVVTVQAALDAVMVIAVAIAARAFARELVIPASLMAAIVPNFIVYSSYILTETIFILFVTSGLAALLWALKAKRVFLLLVLAGLFLGLSLLTRPTATYLPLLLVPVLIFALRTSHRTSWLGCIALSLTVPITMGITVFPLLIANYLRHGYFALSSQPGGHLLFWVYGCLATPWPCADRGGVVAKIAPIAGEYIRAAVGENPNAFEASAAMQRLAFERIMALPKWQIILGMTWGAFRNLMQTSFYEVFNQFNQPLTTFSTMLAPTFIGRLKEFVLVNWNNPLMIMWTVSQVSLVVSRAIEILGVAIGLSSARFRTETVLLLALIVYILGINGPIADPKYRLPIESALIILFALAISHSPLMHSVRERFISRCKNVPANDQS